MNWHEDWDYSPNMTGWNDGRCHGLYGTSAAILPSAATNGMRCVLTTVLLLTGLAGATFQAIQSMRIVGQVVSRPRNANYQPERVKHVHFATEGARAWRHR